MVRTKAGSVSTKAIGAKAPQKVAITAILSGNAPKSKHTGGNPYHPRETPGWQKPITFFMQQNGESSKDESTEAEDHPGLPGIAGEFSSPKSSTSKMKDKENKNGRVVEEGDNSKDKKRKKKSKNDTEIDTEETVVKIKCEVDGDVDIGKTVKKKKLVGMDVESDIIEDASEITDKGDDGQNIEDDESSMDMDVADKFKDKEEIDIGEEIIVKETKKEENVIMDVEIPVKGEVKDATDEEKDNDEREDKQDAKIEGKVDDDD